MLTTVKQRHNMKLPFKGNYNPYKGERREALNSNALKGRMKSHGDTLETLSKILNLSINNLSLKIKGTNKFRVNEANLIRQRYNLTPDEVVLIFFEDE